MGINKKAILLFSVLILIILTASKRGIGIYNSAIELNDGISSVFDLTDYQAEEQVNTEDNSGITDVDIDEDEEDENEADNENEDNIMHTTPETTTNEEPQEEAAGDTLEDDIIASKAEIVTKSVIIDNENIVVYNFSELNKALSENNKYVNVYLGADITMTGGIVIESSKKKVVINGINPLNGSGPYTIDEFESLYPAYTIQVLTNTDTREVVVKNVNIIGRNYYGTVYASDLISNVIITYDSVNYNGPQISYNRGGIVRIIGNSSINITGTNGESSEHEVAEAHGLELGGNVLINHYAPIVSGIWLVGNGSYIKILQGSNITWNETGTYMIYQNNSVPANFIMEKNSQFNINTLNRIFFDISTAMHQFGEVFIDSGARLKIVQQAQGTSIVPILKIKKSLQIADNASLIIIAHKAPQLIYMTGEVDFDAKSLRTLVLYNEANRLIDWSDSSSHNISILSSFINYWRNPCNLSLLGTFDESPLHRFRKKDGVDLSVGVTASSTTTSSVVSNYTADDYGSAPSKDSFNMQTARILTAGKMRLFLDIVTEMSSYISGETEPNALLRATYTDSTGAEHNVFGRADSGGAFEIGVEDGTVFLLDSIVEVCSAADYKTVVESTTVVESLEDQLMFVHVPSRMTFADTRIKNKRTLIPRADDDWGIIISDTRYLGSEWSMYARLTSELVAGEYKIENAAVFIDDDDNKIIMDETAIKIAEGTKSELVETLVGWPPDKGILLDVDTLKVCSNIRYTGSIEWILVDGP